MATSNCSQNHSGHETEGRDTLPGVEAMREEASEWRVEWDDGSSRVTTQAGRAWYACEFDPKATVITLPE